MYICPHCDTPYGEPRRVSETEDLTGEGHYYTHVSLRCPYCGYDADPENDRADRCDCVAGNWKRADEKCCPACMKDLRKRYAAFAETLTAGQGEALCEALDGLDVEDLLEKWRKAEKNEQATSI